MKTLQEIKEKYAIEQGYEDWEQYFMNHFAISQFSRTVTLSAFENHMDEICIRAQKVALENAANNAFMIHKSNLQESKITSLETQYRAKNIAKTTIDKASIINTENLIR